MTLVKKKFLAFSLFDHMDDCRDMTIDYKLIYITNGNRQIYLLCKLLVKQFGK